MARTRQGNSGKQLFKCPECGQHLYYILNIHAEKHGLQLNEYLEKYPKAKKFLVSKR